MKYMCLSIFEAAMTVTTTIGRRDYSTFLSVSNVAYDKFVLGIFWPRVIVRESRQRRYIFVARE
jgi:hypothetical protein